MPANSALNLIPGAVGPQRPARIYAQVSTRQPAPLTFNDPLYIVEPWLPDKYWTVPAGEWPVIHGGTLPSPGADCLIEIDDHGNRRCTWWAGTYSPPPIATWADTAGAIGSNPE